LVAVGGKGEEQDLNFAIPELTQSRLTLDFPGDTHYVYAVAYRGAHRVTPGSGTADPAPLQGRRLEGDLAPATPVHVRSREEAGPPQRRLLWVREAYLWVIRPDSSALSAVYHYTVGKGAVTKLAVQLPDHLDVRSVGVSRLPGEATDEVGPRLQ